MEKYKYQSFKKKTEIKSCSLYLENLKELYKLLSDLNNEALQKEITRLELNKNENQGDDEFQNLIKDVKDAYKIHIGIFGRDGEYLAYDNISSIKKVNLPREVTSIIFTNQFHFNTRYNMDPLHVLKVELDFKKQPVVNFLLNPSEKTTNTSLIEVSGQDETWINGAYEKIVSFIEKYPNSRQWLHKAGVYDLILWLIIMPLSFWTLYNIDSFFSKKLIGVSNVFFAALYLYLIILFMNAYKFLFNYSKWLFPHIDFLTQSKRSKNTLHRIFLGGIILAIIYGSGYDLFKLIITFIKKSVFD